MLRVAPRKEWLALLRLKRQGMFLLRDLLGYVSKARSSARYTVLRLFDRVAFHKLTGADAFPPHGIEGGLDVVRVAQEVPTHPEQVE